LSDPYRKDYRKPQGFSAEDPKLRPHINNEGNFLFLPNYVAFIVPENKDTDTPRPTTRWFGLSDARPLTTGNDILVDLENGRSQQTKIIRKTGRTIFVSPALDVPPKMTGEVRKILGIQSTQIDTRYDLETSKGQESFEKHEITMNQAKQDMLKEIMKDIEVKERFRPGESPFKKK
jgi:hypothetical protein